MTLYMDNLSQESVSFNRIRIWLNDQCGMHYPESKQELLLQRLKRVCETCHFKNLTELADCLDKNYLHNDLDIRSIVITAASINHTYFYREPQVLDYFQTTILPTLNANSVRIWSAAASTGDEAYTIAMIIAEAKGIAWAKQNLAILGTDIDRKAIASAEIGVYSKSALEHTNSEIIKRYFELVDEPNQLYRINKNIHDLCIFRYLNLKTKPYPFTQLFDVVFCRNVLYYFDNVHQERVIESIYDVTKVGGWMITSVTVSLRHLNTRWVNVMSGVYRKI